MRYVRELDRALEEAVERSLKDIDAFALLFSGGLDSSLLAKLCMDIGKKPTLISVYMEGSGDSSHVKAAASLLNLELIEKVMLPDEVPMLVEEALKAVSTANHLDVSIAVPLYAALEAAAWSGFKDAMVGQGADELFAGYHRYLGMDGESLAKALEKDAKDINIARDAAIARSLGIRLLTPYLDVKVVELGLSIPVDLKIKDGERKHVLREVAKRRGLPKHICSREKKAIQYSTGVDKILRKDWKKT